MSFLQHSLALFGYSSIEDITAESLKKTFKKCVIKTHPDKGGKEGDFESILDAYLFLSEMIQRLSGGRSALHSISSPEDLKYSRELIRETNHMLNEIFDSLLESTEHSFFLQEFNQEFEKHHVRENEKGYEAWLKADAMGDATRDATRDAKEDEVKTNTPFDKSFNHIFESTIQKRPTSFLILHPDEMALSSTMGVSLLDEGGTFTSAPYLRPEYTDVYTAYTSDNTLFDKLPEFTEKNRTFEDILKERDMVYQTELDSDLQAIATYEKAHYEKMKLEKEAEHQRKLTEYFNGSMASIRTLSEEKEDSFVHVIS